MTKIMHHVFYNNTIEGQCAAAIYKRAHDNNCYIRLYGISDENTDFEEMILARLYGESDQPCLPGTHNPSEHVIVYIQIDNVNVPVNVCLFSDYYFSDMLSNLNTDSLVKNGWIYTYDSSKSLCENMWNKFYPKSLIPAAVQLIGKPKDLWQSKNLIMGLMATECDPDTVDGEKEWAKHLSETLINTHTGKRIKEGLIIRSFLMHNEKALEALKNVNDKDIEDCINNADEGECESDGYARAEYDGQSTDEMTTAWDDEGETNG